jgi:hypothetical protein
MRFFNSFACLALAASLWACGDDSPGALVNDGVTWQIGCPPGEAGCSSFNEHSNQPPDNPKFDVTCDKGSSGYTVTLIAKPEGMRPRSILTASDLTVGGSDCRVQVTEAATINDAELKFDGLCSKQACTVQVTKVSGFDVHVSLKCEGLTTKDTGDTTRYTLEEGGSDDPVEFSVDNCD